jgi:hypothetical protein
MLADVQSIQVGVSSEASAQSILHKWGRWGEIQTYCSSGECQTFVVLRSILPSALNGFDHPEGKNRLPRLMDNLGLRSAVVGAGFWCKNGVVTREGFSEDVTLPVRDFFARGSAYVPELVVSSTEEIAFRDFEQIHARPEHPSWFARTMKGPYGRILTFTSQDDPAHLRALMDFRFSCITRFSPCHDESEILAEAADVLQ